MTKFFYLMDLNLFVYLCPNLEEVAVESTLFEITTLSKDPALPTLHVCFSTGNFQGHETKVIIFLEFKTQATPINIDSLI